MQPRITQVPPGRYDSAIATRAPNPADMRAARTPPEPAPITNRSYSKSVTDRLRRQRSGGPPPHATPLCGRRAGPVLAAHSDPVSFVRIQPVSLIVAPATPHRRTRLPPV